MSLWKQLNTDRLRNKLKTTVFIWIDPQVIRGGYSYIKGGYSYIRGGYSYIRGGYSSVLHYKFIIKNIKRRLGKKHGYGINVVILVHIYTHEYTYVF